MLILLVFVVLAASAFAEKLHPLSDEFINQINEQQSMWRAGRNFHEDTRISDIKRLLGVLPSKSRLPIKEPSTIKDDLPENFDARENWKNCTSIGTIRDQAACGSCWAFGAVESMTDRICIHSGGKDQTIISAADLLSCCGFYCGAGCDGGYLAEAWAYWVDPGIVSGGDYGTHDGCKAYFWPPCEHHVNGSHPDCGDPETTPECKTVCDKEDDKYEASLTFAKRVYNVVEEEDIKKEIYENGPVEAAFDVYEDFLSYKSGVYKHTHGVYLGGHAVKLLGWGVEDSNPYWIAANSWNEDWGDKGFFKILRGQNVCGIEDDVVTGIPDLTNN